MAETTERKAAAREKDDNGFCYKPDLVVLACSLACGIYQHRLVSWLKDC